MLHLVCNYLNYSKRIKCFFFKIQNKNLKNIDVSIYYYY